MTICELVSKQLKDLDRPDLACLVAATTSVVREIDDDWFSTKTVIEVTAGSSVYDALTSLHTWDIDRIREQFARAIPGKTGNRPDVTFTHDPNFAVSADAQCLADVLSERNMLIAVATGGPRISDVEDHFRSRRRRVKACLAERGIEDPIEFTSLWDWYKFYGQLGGYAPRRKFVGDRYADVISRIVASEAVVVPHREPTGWDRVDRTLEKAHAATARAKAEEDFQTVGLLCREVLISVAAAVYDPKRHQSPDGVTPSQTDAKRMLEAYFLCELPGELNEATRKHARASLDLAVALQHKRTATLRFAQLCLEATSSVVNVTAIISEKRAAT